MPWFAAPLRIAALLGLAVMASACAGPSEGLLLEAAAPAPAAYTRTLLAVTTRQPAAGNAGFLYSGERSAQPRFVSLTMSMPPDRAAGTAPAEAGRPDPAKNITLLSAREMDRSEFAALVHGESGKAAPKRRALVFVHGFNTRFDEAVVRFAQVVDDTGFSGVPILFSWPSRGSVSDYGYDKDSANYSRDAMEGLLTALARDPNISGIDIFAHSMGNWLTMETLRDLALAKDQKTLDRIDTIVLAAPDVDMDVFRTQVARLGPLTSRMTVYASKDDYALRLSRKLFGGKIRAGENTDLDQFHGLGIAAVDLSNVKGGVGKNHGKVFGDGTTMATIGQTLTSAPAPLRDGNALGGGAAALGNSIAVMGASLLPVAGTR
jgi:esterase/lipase superfamily enzyme